MDRYSLYKLPLIGALTYFLVSFLTVGMPLIRLYASPDFDMGYMMDLLWMSGNLYLMKACILLPRELFIQHPYKHHSWSYKSTPITNTPENFDKVWKKHEEFRQAMAEKDRNKIKQLLNPGITETERLQGDMETLVWTNGILSTFDRAWSADDFSVVSESAEDYELVIAADGRLFRLNYKDSSLPRLSPLRYKFNGTIRRFNFDFTLIDGEVVVAF